MRDSLILTLPQSKSFLRNWAGAGYPGLVL